MNPRVIPADHLPVRCSLVLLLGLAAVIRGLIGMHVLTSPTIPPEPEAGRRWFRRQPCLFRW